MIDNYARLLGYFVMCGGALFCVYLAVDFAAIAFWKQFRLVQNLAWARRACRHYKNIEPMPKE